MRCVQSFSEQPSPQPCAGSAGAEHVEARAGAYADSVKLLQISAQARAGEGVEAALIAMATDLNLAMLSGLGFRPPAGAGQNDLLVAIRARDDAALADALARADAALSARPDVGTGARQPPRTAAAAVRTAGPGLVLVSVPGRHAFAEAMDALDHGCDVMIFSDNVPVEQEIALKDLAAERGLLVLGPDCGTAIIGGLGLGFSNAVKPGPLGLVAASGTGAQQVLSLLDYADTGVSAVLGVGGRDLSAAVGGRSARAALAALDEDEATELILLLSKPPAPPVARELRDLAAGLTTPVQFAFVAPGEPDLTAAAERALRAMGMPVPAWPHWPGDPGPVRPGSVRPGLLRGLFAGGTLCYEAMVIAAEGIGPIRSNVPLRPQWHLDPEASAAEHSMIDFGDDRLTAGRAHPMIDQSLRLARLTAEAADPDTGVILLDVVLGHGAHPDPAAEIAPAIAAARQDRDLQVVVSLIGTASDPQDLARQCRGLRSSGAHVFASNAAAARFACAAVGPAS
jgi:FdrA protein